MFRACRPKQDSCEGIILSDAVKCPRCNGAMVIPAPNVVMCPFDGVMINVRQKPTRKVKKQVEWGV